MEVQEMSLFSKTSRPVVDFTQPATQRVPADVGPLVSGRDVKLATDHFLVPTLRMRGVESSWHEN